MKVLQFLLLIGCASTIEAFQCQQMHASVKCQPVGSRGLVVMEMSPTTAGGSVSGRRQFIESVGAYAAAGAVAAVAVGAPPAFADLADLDASDAPAPSSDDEQERIRKKLEMQKNQTGKASSGRVGFQDSMKMEKEKQAAMKKSKEQRRRIFVKNLEGDVDLRNK
eukprot:CAMPEP_0113939908 /NCGR_PEP_ID=MMETSP1339-20121228/6132_1 /TAXON_ID=94617 /ORGANISM="Fibrocapsa japonica" /LENGTH=164 /DNA_ID=CAMNT_0000943547 /DNA_START=110 /DNA_END=605 /DNA_ORIENTATION=- /assembly_acc=CAM_ASM_000762